MTWTREGRKTCGAVWYLDGTDWSVEHCGHPTALWPYLIRSPEGQGIASPAGIAWQTLAYAQRAAEMLSRGEIKSVWFVYSGDGGRRLVALAPFAPYDVASARVAAGSRNGIYIQPRNVKA